MNILNVNTVTSGMSNGRRLSNYQVISFIPQRSLGNNQVIGGTGGVISANSSLNVFKQRESNISTVDAMTLAEYSNQLGILPKDKYTFLVNNLKTMLIEQNQNITFANVDDLYFDYTKTMEFLPAFGVIGIVSNSNNVQALDYSVIIDFEYEGSRSKVGFYEFMHTICVRTSHVIDFNVGMLYKVWYQRVEAYRELYENDNIPFTEGGIHTTVSSLEDMSKLMTHIVRSTMGGVPSLNEFSKDLGIILNLDDVHRTKRSLVLSKYSKYISYMKTLGYDDTETILRFITLSFDCNNDKTLVRNSIVVAFRLNTRDANRKSHFFNYGGTSQSINAPSMRSYAVI